MSPGSLVTEQDRALATVSDCGFRLRQAQDAVRSASELLRRALRAVETVEGELHEATRRLDRFDRPLSRTG